MMDSPRLPGVRLAAYESVLIGEGAMMIRSNFELIERFFQAYGRRDLDAIRQVMAEDARWVFPGDHVIRVLICVV
jgi:hypothetical protein